MLKEFNSLLSVLRAHEIDFNLLTKDILKAFRKIKYWDVFIIIRFECPVDDCKGYGILSSKDKSIKTIKCKTCGKRIDSRRYKARP